MYTSNRNTLVFSPISYLSLLRFLSSQTSRSAPSASPKCLSFSAEVLVGVAVAVVVGALPGELAAAAALLGVAAHPGG